MLPEIGALGATHAPDPFRHTWPTVALPFGTPFTAHVTVASAVPATVAANIACCVAASVALGGETFTVIPPSVTVTIAAALSGPPLGCGLTTA
jgi:hypothetical protein